MANKSGPSKPPIKLMDTSKFVFREVENMKSPAWKHFLCDKKNGVSKCKICDTILKSDSSTSGLVRHLENIHKIQLQPTKTSDEPPTKKGKIEAFFAPKEKPHELQEIVAKMSAVDGFSFSAIVKSESLQYVFKKAGYTLPKAHGALRDMAINQSKSIKTEIKSEISEAKKAGIRMSITNDESTSTRNRRYMNINAHFQSVFKSLGMSRVHGSLPGEKCAELVLKRLEDYGIDLKMVVCFTTD